MKKRIALLLFAVLLLTASGCGSSIGGYIPPAGLTVNYLQGKWTQLVSTGSFAAMSEDGHIVLYQDGQKRYLEDTAAEILSHRTAGVICADENSVYYYTETFAEVYGEGNGLRVYRYFPETQTQKIVYRDTGVSNTDGFLGLEDVFQWNRLASGHLRDNYYFLVDGDTVFPVYTLLSFLVKEAERQGKEISFPEEDFRLAMSGPLLWFADTAGKLWRFDCSSRAFSPLPYDNVQDFFTATGLLFVIPSRNADIDVLDKDGEKKTTVAMNGRFVNRLTLDGDLIFLQVDGGDFIRIDRDLQSTYFSVGFTFNGLSDYRWTVRDRELFYWDGDSVSKRTLF